MCVAYSGIAASLLYKGSTCHSAFAIPLSAAPGMRCNVEPNSVKAEVLRHTKILIWDEISMASSHIIDAVDDLFRQLMRKPLEAFGGKIVICGGDFRQVLPVVQFGNRAQNMEVIAKNSACWTQVQHLYLTRNVRAAADPTFAEWILGVGNGTEIETMVDEVPKITLPEYIRMSNDIAREIFDGYFSDLAEDYASASRRVILCATNEDVRKMNDHTAPYVIYKNDLFSV